MAFNYEALKSKKSGDEKLEWFYDEITNVKNKKNLSEFIELYLDYVSNYLDLKNHNLDNYLERLSIFLVSPAAERELRYENEWQNMAATLIISVERD